MLPIGLLSGCGGLMNTSDAPATKPFHAKRPPPRTWASPIEALYKRLIAKEQGDERLVLVLYGTRGVLATGFALVKKSDGSFEAIHAGIPMDNLTKVEWASTALEPLDGAALWAQVEALRHQDVRSDLSLGRQVHGEGGAQLYFRNKGKHHEATGWAPGALFERDIEKGYRFLIAVVREAAPPYPGK